MSFYGEMSEQDWEAWGQKMENWGQQFEQRAEKWSASYESHAAAAHSDHEQEIERMTQQLETSLESKSARLDALIEQKFGSDFEMGIEATSDALEGLVERCRDTDLAEGETRVMSQTVDLNDEKRTIKIACTQGNEAALRSSRTLATINSSRALCDNEKQSFRDQVDPNGDLDGADD